MSETIETIIPGRAPIELIAYYDEFRSYYPLCELETKRWFVDNVKADWWIFDIGANVGYYSVLFAQLTPNGRVVSFEPTSTAEMLRANLNHNSISNVDIHQIALGATTGVQKDRIFRLWGGEGDIAEYPFYRFDDFVTEHRPPRIDCLKIDVDSFDFEVLRGAEKTLLNHNPVIVIELNHALSKRNQSAGEAFAWLARLGYRQALVLDNDNFVLQRDRHFEDGAAALTLLFPAPLRFNESLDTVSGTEVASPLRFAAIQDGSLVTSSHKIQQSGGTQSLSQRLREIGKKLLNYKDEPVVVSALIGEKIQTSDRIWSYALVLTAGNDQARLADGTNLIFELSVEVFEGKLGIAFEDRETSSFATPERTLAALDGVQRILITAPANRIQALVYRTVAPEGTRTVFSLSGIRVKVKEIRRG